MLRENSMVLDKVNDVFTKSPFCDLFPADMQLEWDIENRVLMLISTREPHLLTLQIFTKNEWLLLTSLIQCYPHYTPHEMLLAQITLISYSDWHQLLETIRQSQPEALVRELKPMYRTLSGVRVKLKKLYPHLKLSLVRNVGYVFTMASELEYPHEKIDMRRR